MSNNSSIGIFPCSFILRMDGILLDRIFVDFELIYYNVWGVYLG